MLLVALILSLGPAPVAHAAGIVVNSTEDKIDDNGECTLREAIIAANTNAVSGTTPGECAAGEAAPTVDVITFTDLAGSPDLYTLDIDGTGEDLALTGDLDITETLTIAGNGQTETIIQAGTDKTNGIDRVFEVRYTTNATFEDVTIRYGRDAGGAGIRNEGTVNLTNSTVSGNSAGSSYGGGIYNYYGTVNLTNSTVSGNSANSGGGIFNLRDRLNLTNSIIAVQLRGGDCACTPNTSNDYNLDSDGSCRPHPAQRQTQ